MVLVLVVLLCALIIAGAPQWQWQVHNLGYYPSGAVFVVLVVVLLLLLAGRL